MFGGTPANLAISVMEETRAEVIAGANLPMLIKLASLRNRASLEECIVAAQDAGRKYISVASYVIAESRTPKDAHLREIDDLRFEARQTASSLRNSLEELAMSLESIEARISSYPGIGHNRPPAISKARIDAIHEAAYAAEVLEGELEKPRPKRSVIELCMMILARLASHLIVIIRWLGSKANIFVDSAMSTGGKILLPTLAIHQIATASKLDSESLIKMTHKLLDLLSSLN
jgi:hypothetical protein